MIKKIENVKINNPINQLKLIGYKYYFDSFKNLFEKNSLPNSILLTGPKGSGKATFVYHFVNFLLSKKEEFSYSYDDFSINENNKSYNQVLNNTHANFSLIDVSSFEKNIKIADIRNTINFLNKSSFSSGIKIVVIDNAELLNTHSYNALLKSLEEPDENTFFFIIHNSAYKIIDTIKSRCIEFKIFFNLEEKKKILTKLLDQNDVAYDSNTIEEAFYFDTPGNILKYLLILKESQIDFLKDKLSSISFLINSYNKKNDPYILSFISLLIELFYYDLSLKNNENLNSYSFNKYKLIKNLNEAEKFNLDKKNIFLSVLDTLQNEQ